MTAWLIGFACAATLAAAMLAYALSAHCSWRVRRHRAAVVGGALGLAVVACAAWVLALGAGAGLCAAIASSMLALVLQPWSAWWHAAAAREHD